MALALTLSASLALPSYVSAATPTAGAACTKAGVTSSTSTKKFTCVKSGKKLVWDKGVALAQKTPSQTTSATTSTSTSSAPVVGAVCTNEGGFFDTPSVRYVCNNENGNKVWRVWTPSQEKQPAPAPQVAYYTAKDQKTIQSLSSKDACSNPANASFQIEAKVDGNWLPVKLIESGYKPSSMCTDPALGLRNSLAYAKVYMDPGTTYRWLYKGEINYAGPRDSQGRAASPEFTIAVPLPPAPIPLSLPVPQSGAVTFANAAANYAQIPQTAWQRVQDAIAGGSTVSIPTTIHIGPNTSASQTAILNGLDRLNKLFSGFTHVSSFGGIVYSAQDLQWAQTDSAQYFQSLGITGGFANKDVIYNQSSAGCEMNGSTAVECGGGMAWDLRQNNSTAGGAYYGVQSGGYWTDALKNNGPMTQVNHEATHNYQIIQFFHTPLGDNQFTSSGLSHDFTPWWFSEGQANGIGISSFIDKLSDYISIRNYTVVRSPGSSAQLPSFTADGMKSFLMDFQPTGPQNKNWMLAYSIGYSAVETLIAIGGPQATLALYALGSNGENWETAFKDVYGITWDQGATILGQVLAAEYAANPMQR